MEERYDVVVVGSGIGGLCAALAARDSGASACVLEAAPREEGGGNTTLASGGMRVAYEEITELTRLMPTLTPHELSTVFAGPYTAERFREDFVRSSRGRANPALVGTIVDRSLETLEWMTTKGVEFQPILGMPTDDPTRKIDGRPPHNVQAIGGGEGLVGRLTEACVAAGVSVEYSARAVKLLTGADGVRGVTVRRHGQQREVEARAVVLAAGGFEANPEWRAKYLGAGWDLARVRGTRFNVGDGLRMALDIGAAPSGNWTSCHVAPWDAGADARGGARARGSERYSYQWGIMVNAQGRRFVDEGVDIRNHTYVAYGRELISQPDQLAWQIFDAKVAALLSDEYREENTFAVRAETLEELAGRLTSIDRQGLLHEIDLYNQAVLTDVPFDPSGKDGRGTTGVSPPKSNWANTIDEPPFLAFPVTGGVSFTYGGLRVDPDSAAVVDLVDEPLGGLFAAGALIGDIFYVDYPGGSGLTSAAVFGWLAGTGAGGTAGSVSTR